MSNTNYMNLRAMNGGKTNQLQIPFTDIGICIMKIKANYFLPFTVDLEFEYRLDEMIYEKFKDYYDEVFNHRLLMNILFMVNKDAQLVDPSDFVKGKTFLIPTDNERLFPEFKNKITTILERNIVTEITDRRFRG